MVFPVENEKSEQHHWNLHIQIRLATKFQLKVIILTFMTNFSQKQHFLSKTKKANTTTEICNFELVYNQSQSMWEFSCGTVLNRKIFVSIFWDFFAGIKKMLILEVGMGTRLSFYEV